MGIPAGDPVTRKHLAKAKDTERLNWLLRTWRQSIMECPKCGAKFDFYHRTRREFDRMMRDEPERNN